MPVQRSSRLDSRGIVQLSGDVRLDARRAVWLETERVLAVADLHLGYAWAHRRAGQMLPVSANEDSIERLLELVADYQPRELALLGDIVHAAVPFVALEEELQRLSAELGGRVELRLLAGNHDRSLAPLLKRCGIDLDLHALLRTGPHLLLHGDSADASLDQLAGVRALGGRIFMGHEHPAIRVGDGVASVKRPCFLVADDLVILPAFSEWVAGANVRQGEFLSALAGSAKFRMAHAILAGKLLAVRL
jgi:uncharacterized protein